MTRLSAVTLCLSLIPVREAAAVYSAVRPLPRIPVSPAFGLAAPSLGLTLKVAPAIHVRAPSLAPTLPPTISAPAAAPQAPSAAPGAAETLQTLSRQAVPVQEGRDDGRLLDVAYDASSARREGAPAVAGAEHAIEPSLAAASPPKPAARRLPSLPSWLAGGLAVGSGADGGIVPQLVDSFLRAAHQNPWLWVVAGGAAVAAFGLTVWAAGAYRERKFMNMSSMERRQALESSSWRDRRLAARVMGKKGEAGLFASQLIERARHDADPRVREAVIEVLGEARARQAVEPLGGILSDKSEKRALREASARALGAIGDTGAFEPLAGVLDDATEKDALRAAAAEALGATGDARAVAPLEKLLAERAADEDEFAFAALTGLLMLGEDGSLARLAASAQEGLVRRIREEDDEADAPVVQMMMDLYEGVYDEHDGEGEPQGKLIAGLNEAFAGVTHPNAARVLAEALRLIRDGEDTEDYTTTSVVSNGRGGTTISVQHHTRDADAEETLEMASDEVLALDDETEEWLEDMKDGEFRRLFAEHFGADAKGLAEAAEDPDLRRPHLLALGLTPEDLARLRKRR